MKSTILNQVLAIRAVMGTGYIHELWPLLEDAIRSLHRLKSMENCKVDTGFNGYTFEQQVSAMKWLVEEQSNIPQAITTDMAEAIIVSLQMLPLLQAWNMELIAQRDRLTEELWKHVAVEG